jgi:hypothetical protein
MVLQSCHTGVTTPQAVPSAPLQQSQQDQQGQQDQQAAKAVLCIGCQREIAIEPTTVPGTHEQYALYYTPYAIYILIYKHYRQYHGLSLLLYPICGAGPSGGGDGGDDGHPNDIRGQ